MPTFTTPINKRMVNMLILEILRQDGDDITVRLRCNEHSMFYWAMQYGTVVEVLEPASLRDRIREALAEMMEKYQ